MADVILTTDTSTTQTLDSTGDVYFLNQGVLHYVTSSNAALDLDGSSAQSDYSVFVNGTIAHLGNGNAIYSYDSTLHGVSITISLTGIVQATEGYRGIYINGSNTLVVNNGDISGAEAVRLGGVDAQLFNNGVITGTYNDTALVYTINMSNTGAHLVNSGVITGRNAVQIDDDGIFMNTGEVIATEVAFDADSSSSSNVIELNNSGVIAGGTFAYDGENGMDQITNSGTMQGDIYTDDSDDILINSGTITGDVDMNDDDDSIINTGTITGSIVLGTGNDIYDGRGGSVSGSVDGGGGDDIYIIDDGTISLVEGIGEGTDTVQTSVGYSLEDNFEDLVLTGAENVRGAGNDDNNVITGNAGDNFLLGRNGDDTITGGDGDDRISGGGGVDRLEGGDGNDYLSSGFGHDVVIGGGGDDVLMGRNGNDRLVGDEGNDLLIGGSGNDDLLGKDGEDILVGGLGTDEMTGGAGADVFQFDVAADSLEGAQDTILDFTVGEDRVDLSALFGDDVLLTLNAGTFTGSGPEVRTKINGTDTRILVDLDGDGNIDMRIDLIDTTGLSVADFIL